MSVNSNLEVVDSEIFQYLNRESQRQNTKLEMIASENFTSKAVMEATGSILTNKYAEGYPSKRYYGGCEEIDKIEQVAIDRAKQLFNAEYANVQPHCGSSANMAVFFGFLNIGDKVLGMNLSHGGHLTHGSPVSFSGKYFEAIFYEVDKQTELIDYEELEKIVDQHKPRMIIAGASSYPRTIDFKKFGEIARRHNAFLMVDMAHIAGLVATELHPSPIPYADVVTSTTHKTLRGPRGGLILVGKNKENFMGITTQKGAVRKYSSILNSMVFPGIQGGPLMHVIAGKAVAFKECMQENFKKYQQQVLVNAKILATHLEKGGARIVSGGTDNHLVLVDVSPFGATGKDMEEWLDEANISTNKNTIPFDTNPPNVTSGIRFGSPALTTRGITEEGMVVVAEMIVRVFKSKGNKAILQDIAYEIKKISDKMEQG